MHALSVGSVATSGQPEPDTAPACAVTSGRCLARLPEALWLLALLVVPLAFAPWTSRTFDQPKALILVGVSLVSVLSLFCARRPGRLLGPVTLPALAVALSYALSTAFSAHPLIALKGNYVVGEIGGTLVVLACIAIGGLVAYYAREPSHVWRILCIVSLAASVAAIYGILQALHFDPMVWENAAPGIRLGKPATSTFGSANYLGCYLTVALPFVWMYARHWPAGWTSLAVVLAGIAASGSRAAWLGTALEIVLWLCWHMRAEWPLWVALLAGLYFAAGAYDANGVGKTIGYRTTVWREVVALAAERPILGYGPDTLGGTYTKDVDTTRWEKTDNRIVDDLYERGIAGLLADLWLFCAVGALALRKGTKTSLMAFVAILGAWTVSMFDAVPSAVMLMEWVSIGLIVAEIPE